MESEEADYQLKQLPCSSFGSVFGALHQMEQELEWLLWEALWPYMCVPVRGTSQNWNNARKYVPCCELCFFLMKHEPADGEALLGSSSLLCDCMRTVESRGAEPEGGNEDTPCKGY